MQIKSAFASIIKTARWLLWLDRHDLSESNRLPGNKTIKQVIEDNAQRELAIQTIANIRTNYTVPNAIQVVDEIPSVPSLQSVDFNGKSFKEIAQIVVDILGEHLLELIGDKSLNRYQRAIELLFRLESSPEEHFDKIAKGDGSLLQSRSQFYTGNELLDNLPAKELEELFLYVTKEPELSLKLARNLSCREDYKKGADVTADPLRNRHRRANKSPKNLLSSGQLTEIERFVAVTSMRLHNIDHFLGIHRNGSVSTSLQGDEFERRLLFLSALCERRPHYKQDAGLTLLDEYRGYDLYRRDEFANHKRTIDAFLDSFDDSRINNFSTRGKLINFLEERRIEDDLTRAVEFLRNLTKLKNIGVNGTYDLLELAVKNRERHPEQEDFTYGYYEQANVASLLADTNERNLKVLGVAQEELNNYGEIINVPRTVGDIDILGNENGKEIFIEVKATACAAENHKEQIDALIGFAKNRGAKAVLIVGNLRELIKKSEHYSQVQQDSYNGAAKRAIDKIRFLADLIRKHNGDLEIWSKTGRDITATVLTVAAKTRCEVACSVAS